MHLGLRHFKVKHPEGHSVHSLLPEQGLLRRVTGALPGAGERRPGNGTGCGEWAVTFHSDLLL